MPFKLLLVPGHSVDILTESALFTRTSILHPDKFLVDLVPPEEATEFGLMRRMAVDGNQYDGIHFLGHASDVGFRLPDESLLDEHRIHSLCVDGGARFVFLNACETGRIAQYLVNKKVAVAIANASQVLDRPAIMNAARFYGALAESQSPFTGGLRAAYDAAAPDDGSFLWLTNGQYTREIIEPIIERMNRFDEERKTRFDEFGAKLDLMLTRQEETNTNITATFAQIRQWIAQQLADFTQSHKRLTLLVKLLIMAVALLTIFFVAGSVMAQTVPDPTPTLLPGCGPSGGQPSKCNTPTPFPTVTPTIATETPTLQPTAPTETPGDTPTAVVVESTMTPTKEPSTPVLLPTATSKATATDRPTEEPTVTPSPTLSEFDQAVARAVKATLTALGCD